MRHLGEAVLDRVCLSQQYVKCWFETHTVWGERLMRRVFRVVFYCGMVIWLGIRKDQEPI